MAILVGHRKYLSPKGTVKLNPLLCVVGINGWVSWETRSKVGFTGQGGYLQLNGATIQTPSNTTSYQTLTIDVAVGFGDVLSLSGENIGSANYEKYFRNFRIYYTPTDINNTTLTDTSL